MEDHIFISGDDYSLVWCLTEWPMTCATCMEALVTNGLCHLYDHSVMYQPARCWKPWQIFRMWSRWCHIYIKTVNCTYYFTGVFYYFILLFCNFVVLCLPMYDPGKTSQHTKNFTIFFCLRIWKKRILKKKIVKVFKYDMSNVY